MHIVVLGTRGIPNIPGGVETHCEELYPRLVELGCKITIITRTPYVTSLKNSYKGVILKHLYAPKRSSIETIFHTTLGIIYAYFLKPDIIHIHAIGPSFLLPLAKLLRLKVVVTHHGPDYNREKWGWLAKKILELGEKFSVKYANQIIVISKTILNILTTKYACNKCTLIPNGVNIPTKSKESNYIESLGLHKQQYIIAVGRFVPEKGFLDLIEAFKSINSSNYRLVLVGDADHESEYSRNLKKLAKNNNIVLTGFIRNEKLEEIFSHAKLFVMPSYHEGLPIALLEAISYNVNVLVSDISPNLELELDKQHYFPTGDIETLSERIVKKLTDRSSHTSRYTGILEKYDWHKIALQTQRVYSEIS